MAEQHPRNESSLPSLDQSAPQRAGQIPAQYSATRHSLLSHPPASPTMLGRRPPICAGRFASPLHSSISSATVTPARAASPDAPRAFSRAAFAEMLDQQEERSADSALPFIRSAVSGTDPAITELKIGIIGAGMAGLYTALILDSLGFHNYEILEAHPHRAGGRVFTHYFDSIVGSTATNGKQWNYIDFGAMRFPCIKIMDRVIGTQDWSLINYLNSHVQHAEYKITLLNYYLSVDNNINYYNSTRKTNAELPISGSDPLHFGKKNGGGLDDEYVKEPYTTWLDPAFDPFKKAMHEEFNTGFQMLLKHDHFSVRAYLRTFKDPHENLYPQELIDYLETLDSATGHYDDALTEAVMDSFDFDSPTEVQYDGNVQWKCIQGGTSQLTLAMLSIIKSKPQQNKRVTKIAPSSKVSNLCLPGNIDVFVADDEVEARTYNHVINTLPPSVVRSLDTSECNFSYDKRTALRVLRSDSSLKVGLLFKTRWWQDAEVMKGKPIKGGQSSTDLPIRTIVYPSYGINDPHATGVLIASYAWAQDAARLSMLADPAAGMARVLELCLSNIATIHDLPLSFLKEQFTGQYHIQDWDQNQYSQGAFALFGPGQFKSLFSGLKKKEMNGRYHTAGEMSSVHHAWIVGALNSAWRCVFEILRVHGAEQKIEELKQKWGVVEEVDMRSLRESTAR